MVKITWKGEAEGPPSCTWNGITFPIGRAVEVTDETMIRKAKGNPFFKVDDEPAPIEPSGAKSPAPQWREPATEADPADQLEPSGVSFFDDPPEVPLDMPPDYPPEEEPKRKPGRPRKVTADGNS
jgi:hypothetical protein